jgi:hypothetical protein
MDWIEGIQIDEYIVLNLNELWGTNIRLEQERISWTYAWTRIPGVDH